MLNNRKTRGAVYPTLAYCAVLARKGILAKEPRVSDTRVQGNRIRNSRKVETPKRPLLDE